jgi:hypothetical protein
METAGMILLEMKSSKEFDGCLAIDALASRALASRAPTL